MIYVSLPITSQIGWGICGRYISQELATIADVRLITNELVETGVRDEFDFRALAALLPSPTESTRLQTLLNTTLDGPLLTAIVGFDLQPMVALRGTRTVGYTFFESNYISETVRANAQRSFDHIVAGSTACEMRLREGGLTEVSTIIQGIDPSVFEPSTVPRRYFRDQFVIFSGGKFEFRKGHDVVVRAFKVLQDKYSDAVLVAAWHNPFKPSRELMMYSPLVRFAPTGDDPTTIVRQFLTDNGIQERRAVVLGPKTNFMMNRYYKQTDIGLFPNRCEGGTNLVMMEYMACGKPVIGTFSSGHRDILTSDNSVILNDLAPLPIQQDGRRIATWDDPNLDEVVAALEFAYLNREHLRKLGQQAGQDLKRHTWLNSARKFLSTLTQNS